MLYNFISSEFIKLKKSYGLFIYLFFFLILFTLLGFTLHLARWGNQGNTDIPLNITYSGYIFYYGFFLSLLIFNLFIDSEIRGEINSGRIYFILTQRIDRKTYFIGKTIYWSLIFIIWIFFISFLSYKYANIIFSSRLPVLLNGNPVYKSTIVINLILNILYLFPLIFLFITLSFFTGFSFKLPSTGIVFYIIIDGIAIFTKILHPILIPFKMIKIYNNTVSRVIFFNKEILYFLIITFLLLVIMFFLFYNFIKKREI